MSEGQAADPAEDERRLRTNCALVTTGGRHPRGLGRLRIMQRSRRRDPVHFLREAHRLDVERTPTKVMAALVARGPFATRRAERPVRLRAPLSDRGAVF